MLAFFYRVFLVLAAALCCLPVLAQDQYRSMTTFANMATRIVEEGKTDTDRLYLFYFSYSDIGRVVECNVRTVVINNLACSSAPGVAVLPYTAPWIVTGFCDRHYCDEGVGDFSCTRKALGDGKYEYIFHIPSGLERGYSSHRLVMQSNPYKIFEYSGSLFNYVGLDRTIKSAMYVPLISASDKYWMQEVDLGCSRIAVPAIRLK